MTSRFLASGVIPGHGLLPASPESITTIGNYLERFGVMDSGLAQARAPEGLGKNGTGRLCDNLRIKAVDGHDGSEDLR
jgi:hypothetical protein